MADATSPPISAAISAADVSRAKHELDRMKRSLTEWLKFRTLNDAVVAGSAPTKKPRAYAVAVIGNRNMDVEARLAKQLYVLLTESFPDAAIPSPDVTVDPQAAVTLARIAISGVAPAASSTPAATGATWLWPVLIVGGLLLAVTTAIQSSADVAKTQEQTACIEAGACTDYGFWLKVGGISALGYVLWQMGVGGHVKRALAPKRRG